MDVIWRVLISTASGLREGRGNSRVVRVAWTVFPMIRSALALTLPCPCWSTDISRIWRSLCHCGLSCRKQRRLSWRPTLSTRVSSTIWALAAARTCVSSAWMGRRTSSTSTANRTRWRSSGSSTPARTRWTCRRARRVGSSSPV